MKLLSISPFPWEPAFHGGQIRVQNIIETYRNFGINVRSIGITPSSNYNDQVGFVKFSDKFYEVTKDHPWEMGDFYLGEAFFREDDYFKTLFSQVKEDPEIVQVEHPWLFRAAKRYCQSCKSTPKIIYSSHNVEYELKKDILLLNNNLSSNEIEEEVKKIRSLEEEAIYTSDFVIAVTERDQAWISSINPNSKVLLCPNGVRDFKNFYLQKNNNFFEGRYGIYCASGHPPNVDGLYQMFKKGLVGIRPEEKLIIVGGICESLMHDSRFDSIPNFRKRTILLGNVSEEALNELIVNAHAVILPLVIGGGSNLKTAEALVSGKWVVATECALRGMEKFRNSSGVLVATDGASFCRNLRFAMNSAPLRLKPEEIINRSSLTWKNTLKELRHIVGKNYEN